MSEYLNVMKVFVLQRRRKCNEGKFKFCLKTQQGAQEGATKLPAAGDQIHRREPADLCSDSVACQLHGGTREETAEGGERGTKTHPPPPALLVCRPQLLLS